MNIGQFYKFLNFVSTKENSGLTFDPDKFNLNIPIVTQKVYDFIIDNYEIDRRVSAEIKPYIAVKEEPGIMIDATTGRGTLPTDYYTYSNGTIKYAVTGIADMTVRPVEFLSNDLYEVRGTKMGATKPTLKYPIATIRGNEIQVNPKSANEVRLVYIKSCESPKYDYYIDAYGEEQYMPPNTTHNLLTSEVGSAGQTTGIIRSLTVDFLMYPGMHLKLAAEMLKLIGVNLRDQVLEQYAQQMNIGEAR